MLNVYCLDSASPRLVATYDLTRNSAPKSLELPDAPCWLDLYAPALEEMTLICGALDIPGDFLTDSLDPSERPHVSQDGGKLLAITQVSVPVEGASDDNTETPYETLPLGLVFSKDMVVSVSMRPGLAASWVSGFRNAFPTPVATAAKNSHESKLIIQTAVPEKDVKVPVSGGSTLSMAMNALGSNQGGVTPPMFPRPALLLGFTMLQQSSIVFVKHLQELEKMAEKVELSMRRSMRNEELSRMMQIQKTLVYFMTALKANAPVMEKLYNLPGHPLQEDEAELLLDGLRECRQATEMGEVYSQIIASMSDTFAAMISNNVNSVVKFLTAVTLILMAPSAIFSLYGMNVPLPFQDSPEALLIIVGFTIAVCIGLWLYLTKKHWM